MFREISVQPLLLFLWRREVTGVHSSCFLEFLCLLFPLPLRPYFDMCYTTSASDWRCYWHRRRVQCPSLVLFCPVRFTSKILKMKTDFVDARNSIIGHREQVLWSVVVLPTGVVEEEGEVRLGVWRILFSIEIPLFLERVLSIWIIRVSLHFFEILEKRNLFKRTCLQVTHFSIPFSLTENVCVSVISLDSSPSVITSPLFLPPLLTSRQQEITRGDKFIDTDAGSTTIKPPSQEEYILPSPQTTPWWWVWWWWKSLFMRVNEMRRKHCIYKQLLNE